MKNLFTLLAVGILLAGCAPNSGPGTGEPGIGLAPTKGIQGYADGTKYLGTVNLAFTATGKGMNVDTTGNATIVDVPIKFRNSNDPAVIIATVNGQDITLNFNGSSYVGNNGTYSILGTAGLFTSDASGDQSMLIGYYINEDPSMTSFYGNAGYVSVGLNTDPAQVAGRSGSATYNGNAVIEVLHGNLNAANNSAAAGTATLTANFGAGTIGGSMSLTDAGSAAGFMTKPTTVTINPATISGNGFATTLSLNPADFALSSVTGTSVLGFFYGVGASSVGGTFNGTGISKDGTTSAVIIGGFSGQ